MNFIRRLSAFIMLLLPLLAAAVPANRTPRVYTQPDGSTVTLRQIGDEFFHYFLTDDDKMVIASGSGYYFAAPASTGRPMPTQMLASDPARRTADQARMLASVDKAAMLSYGTRTATAKRAERQAAQASMYHAPAAASSSTWPSGIGLFPNNTYPVTGSPHAVIILVAFSDQAFTVSNAKDYFTGLASEVGFSKLNASGSALDYFTAASNGMFTPQFDVLGPVTLSNNMAYYGANDSSGNDVRPAHMVRDAIQALDSTTDFSKYDNDGDGVIDNVYVIYSGLGEAAGGSANTIWPHSWDIAGAGLTLRVDGKSVRSYACSGEYLSKNLADGIGTFCHEFSHVMGLPDLYDTNYANAEKVTPNSYSLMDYGSYSNNSRTPPTYSVYERNAMGWADIEEIKENDPRKVSLEHMLTSNKGYVIATDKTNEFFLLENRQKSGWDSYLPGHGMLVWHIDYNSSKWTSNEPNNTASHQYVDLVEAGGQADNTSSSVMAQYPFPGTKGVTSFTSSTTPALKSWSGKSIDAPITDITETTAGLISFNVSGGEAIDKPVCNITTEVVESETPVTVTLTLPASAKDGDEIEYIYMYNDGSDMVDGTYTGPITISKSAEFEYWTKRGDLTSEITAIRIFVGEKAPTITSFKIVYVDSTNDSSSTLTENSYASKCEEGADIATMGSGSAYVYDGKIGLKFGSSKNNGSLILNLAQNYREKCSKVVVNACCYSNDAGKLAVNGSSAVPLTSALSDYTFELDGTELSSLTLSSEKRIYVKSIEFFAETSGDEPVLETVAAPVFSIADGAVKSGTVVTLSTTTEGAHIRYTVDESTPSAESQIYTDEGITITEPVTIHAIAFKDGWNPSDMVSATYTIATDQEEDPDTPDTSSCIIVYSDHTSDATNVFAINNYPDLCDEGAEIASCTSRSNVYQGTHGLKFSSSKNNGELLLSIADDYQKNYVSVVVKACRYNNDASQLSVNGSEAQSIDSSDLAEYTFTLNGDKLTSLSLTATKRLYVKSIELVANSEGEEEDPAEEIVATPEFSIAGGEVESGTVVTLSTATEGASIRYTTDGTVPTEDSDLYTEDGIEINEDMTVNAIAYKEGWKPSEMASATYTVAADEPPVVGEPCSDFIIFKDGGNEGTGLTSDNYSSQVESGAEIASLTNATNAYFGATGIRLSSSKNNGSIELTFAPDYVHKAYAVVVTAKKYRASEAPTINVNDLGDRELSDDLEEISYPLDDKTELHKLTIAATGRAYIKSIEVKYYKTTSVESLSAELPDTNPVYYTLQGIQVAHPQPGQIYICRRGDHTTKIIWK